MANYLKKKNYYKDFQIIISRNSSKKLLNIWQKSKKTERFHILCDFNLNKKIFYIENKEIFFEFPTNQKKINIPIPLNILQLCYKNNIAYEILIKEKLFSNNEVTPIFQQQTIFPIFQKELYNHYYIVFTPLILKSNDGTIFKLCEPNLEREIIGPILEIQVIFIKKK